MNMTTKEKIEYLEEFKKMLTHLQEYGGVAILAEDVDSVYPQLVPIADLLDATGKDIAAYKKVVGEDGD